jgi:GNAT superfamily N-acetyltransferase
MAGQFQIAAPQPQTHRQEMFDLIAKAFSQAWGYFTFRDMCSHGYIDHSLYDWKTSRIGLLESGEDAQRRIVTHFGVWGYTMRIGSARVHCGGIGAVATDFDHRRRGFMRRTIRAAIAAMRVAGYDLSILFGIDDFYHRFGYTRAWSDLHYAVKVNDLPVEKPRLLLKAALPHPQLDRLFNRLNARMTGTAVRPTFSRPNPLYKHQGFSWKQGRHLAGYIGVVDRGARLDVIEATGDAHQCLCAAAELARRFGADEVRFVNLPYNSELAAALRAGNCVVEIQHRRCGAAMVRLINLPQALAKMSGELGRRLRNSPLAGWRGRLLIADGTDSAMLSIERGRLDVQPVDTRSAAHLIRGGDEMAQLLIGSDEPLRIAAAHGIRLHGDGRLLLPVLFPAQHPMLHMLDRF